MCDLCHKKEKKIKISEIYYARNTLTELRIYCTKELMKNNNMKIEQLKNKISNYLSIYLCVLVLKFTAYIS